MKKVFAVLVIVVMMLTMTVPVFAASNDFIKSPSGNPSPDLGEIMRPSDDCTADIIITPYSDRDDLDNEGRETIEEAYDSIKNNEDGSSLDKAFDKLATDDHPADDMAISDLFDVDYTGCDDHDHHEPVVVHLSAETLDNFVGLIAYVNGEWKVVEGAKVDKEESTLTFSASYFAPYAIAVDSTFAGDGADTGDSGIDWVWFVLLGVSGVGLVTVVILYRKSTTKNHEA